MLRAVATSRVEGTCGRRATRMTSKMSTTAATPSVTSHTHVGMSIVPPLMMAGCDASEITGTFRGSRLVEGTSSHNQVATTSVGAAPVRSARRGRHLPQLLLQVRDLVAQPPRQLEVQVGRGLVHLLGEVLDELGELGRGQVPVAAGAGVAGRCRVAAAVR